MQSNRPGRIGIAAFALVGIWSIGHGQTVRPVALTGAAAPGTIDGVSFAAFLGMPSIDELGRVAFASVLTGSSVTGTNDSGIWAETSGALDKIARTGDQVPDAPIGVTYGSFPIHNPLSMNGIGHVAFLATLSGSGITSSNAQALMLASGVGGVSTVVRNGGQVPGWSSVATLADIAFDASPALNDSGVITWRGELSRAGQIGTRTGIWSFDPAGGIRSIAEEGATLVPGPDGGIVQTLFHQPILSATGEVAFVAGVNASSNNAVVQSDGFSSRVRARAVSPNSVSNNDGGDIAFHSSGIHVVRDGEGSTVIADSNISAPGTESGTTFLGIANDTTLNASGHTVLAASLKGPAVTSARDSGLWTNRSGALELLAREGDSAPDTVDMARFGSFNSVPPMNNSDQIVVLARLTGDTVHSGNDTGIWVAEGTSGLRLFLREGDLLDVSDDSSAPDLRTIASFGFVDDFAPYDGRGTLLNDAGEFAFQATFTDGSSGIFVGTIPAPGGIAPLTAIAVAAALQRSTRRSRCN